MRFLLSLLICAMLAGPAFGQLNGTYTVGGVSPDYASIGSAVSNLNAVGTSGEVTFEIRPGTYDEQVTILNFARTGSPTDRVIFKPAIPNSTVTWTKTGALPAKDWVVRLDGASYITFRGIDFESGTASPQGRLIYLDNLASYITVFNCELTGDAGGDAPLIEQEPFSPGNYEGLRYENNVFTRGGYGVYVEPSGGANSDSTHVLGNTFSGQRFGAVWLRGNSNAMVQRNTVSNAAWSDAGFVGIWVRGSFSGSGSNTPIVSRNEVDMQFGERGISVDQVADERIINNIVSIRGGTPDFGLRVGNDAVVRHNTIRVAGAGTALSIGTGGTVQNNIFYASSSGLAIEASDISDLTASYNNVYSASGSLVESEGTAYGTLTTLFAAYPELSHTWTNVDVTFVATAGTSDLRLAGGSVNDVDLLARPIDGIANDIDGDARGAFSVYKGADEGTAYDPLDNADTGLGWYTVGGASPDFASVERAIFHVNHRGLKGPVSFRIRPGTYDVHATLDFPRYGASDDTLLFRPADTTLRATLRRPVLGTGGNWLLRLKEMHHVTIRRLDFTTIYAAPEGRLLVFEGRDVDHVTVRNCTFTGLAGETSEDAALVYGNLWGLDEHVFTSNTFTEGSIGLLYEGLNSTITETAGDLELRDNVFTDQAVSGLDITSHGAEAISNTVTSTYDSVTGMRLAAFSSGSGRNTIAANEIHLPSTGSRGIVFDRALGSVVNNIVNARQTALRLADVQQSVDVYHNTLRASIYAFRVEDNATTFVPERVYAINNIFYNGGSTPGFALAVPNPDVVERIEWNIVKNAGGAPLIGWGGIQYSTLQGFKNATGKMVYSNEIAVTFADVSTGDLRLAGASIGESLLGGRALDEVSEDIDGDPRSARTPYMGADESDALNFGLRLSVQLDGPYVRSSPMSTGLLDGGHLPDDHPYSGPPWNHAGAESVDSGFFAARDDIVDWVLVRLLTVNAAGLPGPPVDSEAYLLTEDNRVVFPWTPTGYTADLPISAGPGSYFVAVYHRNHVP
ncbi:MAG: right-handed parallel beta-helix repeat-containing protein, partial [Bacteroidota bacterium]